MRRTVHDSGYRSQDFEVGQRVTYHAPHVPFTQPGEEGVVTSIKTDIVFVRYDGESHSWATLPHALIPITSNKE